MCFILKYIFNIKEIFIKNSHRNIHTIGLTGANFNNSCEESIIKFEYLKNMICFTIISSEFIIKLGEEIILLMK